MEFFSLDDCRKYFNIFNNKIAEEVELMSDEEIMSCDFEEWEDYICSKYHVEPISLFENNIIKKISERKVRMNNPFYRTNLYEKEYYDVDGYCISFKIYYDGDPELFKLKPSSKILTRFPYIEFTEPNGENCGSFTLEYLYTRKELEGIENQQDYIKNEFENNFKNYRTMIQNVNKEVQSYNESIKGFAENLLNKRKEKAVTLTLLSEKLEIPMELNSNVPNIKPIPLKRINRKPSQKPNTNLLEKEYYISDEDYENINNIILMNGTTMEITARSYLSNNEEELRDHLIATLNTHYDNVTGETFRKIGKTDILIEFDKKAAFIGECKVWYGVKQFSKSIQQLLNYSTWKDIKCSIIIFNKENKVFKGIIDAIDIWIKENTRSHTKTQKNIWKCKYYRTDMQVEIDICVLLFDLYVDENQLQDNRYKGK